jgi:YgiT-type zinc finger domain-containing protein
MEKKTCSYCGSSNYELLSTDYLYSYAGKYLLVPDTPVEVCSECGMIYYEAKVLKVIERKFFAIQDKVEIPDKYIDLPSVSYQSI